ncbi:MAG: glycosyl transferase group 1 [Thermoleophilia bacterium]|nr:glycosyl transferase group 1 [Thermoleophilia bacterium]
MEPQLRIAVLTTSWPRDARDATGRFLANQVERLEAAGCEVTIVAPRSARADGFDDAGLAGGSGIVANARRRPWRVPLLLWHMTRTLRRAARGVDIVHANWLLTAPFAALAGRPVVLTLHGSGSAGRFEDLRIARDFPRLFRWLVRRAAVVIAVSEALADAARAAGARDVRTIPHGVDVPDARTAPPNDGRPLVALFAGRLSPEKGTQALVEAFARPVDGVQLVVAGDGPERARIAALPDVEMLGVLPSDALRQQYDRATMLVMPSLREGFGVVALEAMAHGVPVIAGSVGGLAALVQHEHTGLHVAPGSADELRAAVERLRDDPTLRGRLGEAARKEARENYSWLHVTQQLIMAFRDAVNVRR